MSPPAKPGVYFTELSRIKRELAEIKMERDFIKECAVFREAQWIHLAVRYDPIESIRQI